MSLETMLVALACTVGVVAGLAAGVLLIIVVPVFL